jgi:elongation factor Ts
MTEIDPTLVKQLRDETGAPMMDCKKALIEAKGDLERAKELLRMRGQASAASKAGRTAAEGRIFAYIHHNHRLGVMVEVNCETDFVARSQVFEDFLKDICHHVAFKRPQFLSRDQVPAEAVEKERSFLLEQAEETMKGKPEAARLKAIEGRLDKFFAENCLMEQAFVKDDKQTIEEMRKALISKVGENVVVRRFAVFEVGAK